MRTLNEGFKIDYTVNKGMFLTYHDKISASASIQDALYADDLTLVAESRGDLQNMVNAITRACKRRGMSISATSPRSSQ